MEKSKIVRIILLALFVFALITPLISALSQGEKAESVVPISGLELENHLLLFNVIIPNVLIPIFIIIFPLVFVPLFLFIKRKVWYKYEDTYIEIPSESDFDIKKFVRRFIYLFLLMMGLSATFLNIGIFSATDFLAEEQRNYWIDQIGIEKPLYVTDIFNTIASVALPVAVGLWSIGWALEDCGLMHYNLPEKEEKMLYEIEPVYRKYQSIIKGYAGISAILYFVSAIIYYVLNFSDISFIASILFGPIIIVFLFVPSYFLYLIFIEKVLKKIVRRGMEEARIITKEELNI